jgi:hypothetical protein
MKFENNFLPANADEIATDPGLKPAVRRSRAPVTPEQLEQLTCLQNDRILRELDSGRKIERQK